MKKIIAFGMAAAMLGAAGWTVSAAATESEGILNPPKVTVSEDSDRRTDKGTRQRPELTEAQKAEMEARKQEAETKRAGAKAKWDAVPAADKEALYSLQRQALELEIQEVNKLKELGMIDADRAAKEVERLQDRISKIGTSPAGFGPGGPGLEGKAPGKNPDRPKSGKTAAGGATASSLS